MSTIIIDRRTETRTTSWPWTRNIRWAAAAVFVTGAALQVAEFVLENPLADNHARVAHWIAHPGTTAASMALGLLAVPFLLWGFAILTGITRRASKRLSVAAFGLISLAMLGLAGVHGVEMVALSQATGGHPAAAVSILDSHHVVAPIVVLMVMFLGGALFGTLTLAAATWRSPLLPRIVPFGIVAFLVLDLAVGVPLVSHVVALANALVVAWAIVTGYSRGGSSEATMTTS